MEYRIIDFDGLHWTESMDLGEVPEAPSAWFNGYGPFDRELEDVMIQFKLNKAKDGFEIVKSSFPSRLNLDHYLKGLIDYIKSTDFFDKKLGSNCDSIMVIKREDETKPWRYVYED